MGVPGLWDELKPTETRSLASLAWLEGFKKNEDVPCRRYRLGIDASIWLFRAKERATATNHEKAEQAKYHAIDILFAWLKALSKSPILPLFVFDGPGRPAFKRNKVISGRVWTGPVETAFTLLIEKTFGWQHWTAPGEAEAELAYLCSEQQIDAVLSEDVDTLIFGAPTVLRVNVKSQKNPKPLETVDLYDAIDLAVKADLGYDAGPAAWTLVALLSGGDYDTVGLERCGPKIALSLARAGFGTRLVDTYKNMDRAEFIRDWLPVYKQELVEELRTNSLGRFGQSKQPKLAKKLLASTFPDLDVLESYVHPLTSASLPETERWPGFREGVAALPSICGIIKSLDEHLSWTGNRNERETLKKAHDNIYDSAILGAILKEVVRPGTWSAECSKLDIPKLSTVDTRLTDYWDARRGRKRAMRPFERSFFPLVTQIRAVKSIVWRPAVTIEDGSERVEKSYFEYRCDVDVSRFNYETRNAFAACSSLRSNAKKTKLDLAEDDKGEGQSLDPIVVDSFLDGPGPEPDGESADSSEVRVSRASSPAIVVQFGPKISSADADTFNPKAYFIWLPELILKATFPHLVKEYEARLAKKEEEEAAAAQRKRDRAAGIMPSRPPPKRKEAPPTDAQRAVLTSWSTSGPASDWKGKGRAPSVEGPVVRTRSKGGLREGTARVNIARQPSPTDYVDLVSDPDSPGPSTSHATTSRSQPRKAALSSSEDEADDRSPLPREKKRRHDQALSSLSSVRARPALNGNSSSSGDEFPSCETIWANSRKIPSSSSVAAPRAQPHCTRASAERSRAASRSSQPLETLPSSSSGLLKAPSLPILEISDSDEPVGLNNYDNEPTPKRLRATPPPITMLSSPLVPISGTTGGRSSLRLTTTRHSPPLASRSSLINHAAAQMAPSASQPLARSATARKVPSGSQSLTMHFSQVKRGSKTAARIKGGGISTAGRPLVSRAPLQDENVIELLSSSDDAA